MSKLKAAVIGCGAAGVINHIPWYAYHDDVELVGLVDANLPSAERCAKRWGGRAYASSGDMLEKERPDLVSIATPVHLHLPQTLEALNSGSHVLCEKPFARTPGECQQMIDLAGRKGLILGAALDKRFSLAFQRAHELIQAGQIGTPRFFRCHWSASIPPYDSFRAKRMTGGGVFQDVGSHFIDLCSWLMGSQIKTVQGAMDLFEPIREVEDHAVAMLGLENGRTGLIEASWVGPRDLRTTHLEEIWVYGSEGAVKVLNARRVEPAGLEVYERKTNTWRIEAPGYDMVNYKVYQYKRMIDEFVRCVREGVPFVPSGIIARKVSEVVVAFYQSWFTDKKVALPLREEPPLDKIFLKLREISFPNP